MDSSELVGIVRREFFYHLPLSAGALIAYLVFPSSVIAQQSPRDIFSRGVPYNVKSLSMIISKESKSGNILTAKEQMQYLEEIQKQNPILRERRPESVSSYTETRFRIEPDKKYADNLIKEANISIDDILSFLNSKYISKIPIAFIVPQVSSDMVFKSASSDILFYLVSDLGQVITTTYKFKIDGMDYDAVIRASQDFSGENSSIIRVAALDKGFRVNESWDGLIFYNTSMPIIKLIETPAIEFLHQSVRKYTIKHLTDELKDIPRTYDDLMNALNKHVYREEKLVHALSILWWFKYNMQRKFNFTQQELNERFAQYEIEERFRGTNQLSRDITKIGVQKAIELYVNNPNELFREAGIK